MGLSCKPTNMADHQTERAFQKQPTIFLNKKAHVAAKSKKSLRYVRSVGLGFKTPREAIDGTYIDKKCPFTGDVSIRGRILTGRVQKMKMMRTIVIRREYLHYQGGVTLSHFDCWVWGRSRRRSRKKEKDGVSS